MIRSTGVIVIVLSVAGLLLGLQLTRSLADDLRSTVTVSQSALMAIDQTIEAVDGIAADTATSLETASESIDSASANVEGAMVAVEQMADFLDEDLPDTIESIQSAMPAAIQTAAAIDTTLSALSLFGVDYDPEEPFGQSLARVNAALASLPAELRTQSESLSLMVPSAEDLAGETADLSRSVADLSDRLAGFTDLTESYQTTLVEAEAAIEQTDASVDTSLWLIRALVAGMALAGVLVGVGLLATGRSLDDLHAATAVVVVSGDVQEDETVGA
jgi:chromosome segregation ATPase